MIETILSEIKDTLCRILCGSLPSFCASSCKYFKLHHLALKFAVNLFSYSAHREVANKPQLASSFILKQFTEYTIMLLSDAASNTVTVRFLGTIRCAHLLCTCARERMYNVRSWSTSATRAAPVMYLYIIECISCPRKTNVAGGRHCVGDPSRRCLYRRVISTRCSSPVVATVSVVSRRDDTPSCVTDGCLGTGVERDILVIGCEVDATKNGDGLLTLLGHLRVTTAPTSLYPQTAVLRG